MSTTPPRPDEALAQRREERRWLPALAVLGVIVFVTGGSQVVGSAIVGPAGPAFDVGGIVTVMPEPGWGVVSVSEELETTQVLWRRGAAALLVVAIPRVDASAQDLARGYADDALSGRFAQLTIGDSDAEGSERVSFGYVGVTDDGIAVEGVVVVVVEAAGDGVVFDGFAPKGSLGAAIEDLRRMVASAEVT